MSGQLGSLARRPVHPASPVLLTKNGPLGTLHSRAGVTEAPRTAFLPIESLRTGQGHVEP